MQMPTGAKSPRVLTEPSLFSLEPGEFDAKALAAQQSFHLCISFVSA